MRRLLMSLLVCLVALVTVPSLAGEEQDAKRAFAEGTKLYGDGQLEEALEKFREAHEGTQSPNARLYVARCLKDLGRFAEAYREMKATLDEASTRAETSRKYAKTRDAAAAQLALIERKVGKVVVAVVGGDDDTEVTVDDETLPKDQQGVPLVYDPGTLKLRAESPGKPAVEQEVEVEAGETITVTLQIKAPDTGGDEGGDKGGDKGGDTGPEPGGMNGMQVAGIVLTVVGVAGMGVFGVMGPLTLDRRDTLEEECGGTNCPDSTYQETIDEGETFKLVANIGLIAGIVGIAGGVTLLTVGTLTDDETVENTTVAVGPQGAFVGYTWQF
ncbi:MAG: tetratricopeptide repeat protein [Deltaproteobacteria bacterium]|jgi:hypothetical protein|nr:tetratricopeptide repeat protein [Deltaproteobacteria bacterium]MBW2535653.1 tetratricopeptide repeat protein [Deltaproteobacteria bacterium]